MSKHTWRKASRSGASGNDCVEVAADGDRMLVRDSKHRDGGVLHLDAAAFRAFVAQMKGGAFDLG
jgi:hypothetical protein